jgi:hypothetical protein
VAQVRHHDQPHGMAAARMGGEGNTHTLRLMKMSDILSR